MASEYEAFAFLPCPDDKCTFPTSTSLQHAIHVQTYVTPKIGQNERLHSSNEPYKYKHPYEALVTLSFKFDNYKLNDEVLTAPQFASPLGQSEWSWPITNSDFRATSSNIVAPKHCFHLDR
jgi:hypothetical protein